MGVIVSKRGSGSSAKAGGTKKYEKTAFNSEGRYIVEDEDGDWIKTPDPYFEARLKKYSDSWTENERTDGSDLQITGTPRQIAYARDIIKKYFDQFDKKEKFGLKIAKDKSLDVGERKHAFDNSVEVRGAKMWHYNALKGGEIKASAVIKKRDIVFPITRIVREDNGAYTYINDNVSKIMRQYRKHKKG